MSTLKFEIVKNITEKKKVSDKTKYYYFSEVRCKDCGYTKVIYKNDTRHMQECKMCNLKKHTESFVGYENKAYKVISFSHQQGKKLYYKIVCKNCTSEVVMRKDAITNINACTCINCKGNGIKASLAAPLNIYQYYYMNGAKQRNLEWHLSEAEFAEIVIQKCTYCGDSPKPIQHLKRYTKVKQDLNVNGVDRLDPLIGYTLENSIPCCTMCNRMKLDYSESLFLSHISKIYKHSLESSTTIPNGSTLQANGRGNGEGPII